MNDKDIIIAHLEDALRGLSEAEVELATIYAMTRETEFYDEVKEIQRITRKVESYLDRLLREKEREMPRWRKAPRVRGFV